MQVDIYISERSGSREIRIPWLPETIQYGIGEAIFASFTILPSTNSDTAVVFLFVQSIVAAMCFHVLPGTTTPHSPRRRPRDASVNILPVVVMNTT